MNPIKSLIKTNEIQMLDQFYPACHLYKIGVTDVMVIVNIELLLYY